MKKTLLLGTALMVGVAGFAQNTAKKAVNPKYLQKASVFVNNKMSVEPQPVTGGIKANTLKKGNPANASACSSNKFITTSYNCFGVGGGSTTSSQNCLTYNKDLNSLVWTQRGSKLWSLNTTSGSIQATIINASTLALDSVIVFHDSSATTTHHARYPSGTFLNPTGNTDYHNAFAVAFGQVIDNGSTWQGTDYVAKPLWSKSALTHTAPRADSLFAASNPTSGPALFGMCANGSISAAPISDSHAFPDGKTVKSIGGIGSPAVTCTNCNPLRAGVIATGVVDATGKVVNWSADTIAPAVRYGALGYSLSEPRMAFGPDGLHGYVVFLGRLATNYGNKSADSAFTPILYATTDGGASWTQKLAGYDWMCKHPEVEQNVGELTGMKRFYTFDEYIHGADITVDANNVLHFVTCVDQSTFSTGDIDSLGIFSPVYQYDYQVYHPIIWDFMTDGTDWKTMMVDSIMSAACGSDNTIDTTATHTSMGGTQPLAVSSHITVSRSTDGSKIFYGWADSDPGVTGVAYNIQPDIYMKGFDVASGRMTAKINATNISTCFYPYLSEYSYFDGSNWVVPAVYGVGDVVTSQVPQTTYDASSQINYFYSNCGTFANSDFGTPTWVYTAPTGTDCAVAAIKHNNEFESSINNYPNPFNNNTTIAVTLTENKNVDVKVYNAIGTLVFSKKVSGNVGENTVNFDATNLSAGVYYYTVTAGNQQATKKMIIQK